MTARTDEIRARLEAAELERATGVYSLKGKTPFAMVIANAPTDLEYLLARVERLEGLLNGLRDDTYYTEIGEYFDEIDAALGDES